MLGRLYKTQVAVEEDETGHQVGDALADIVAEIGRWEMYLEGFSDSPRIQKSIIKLYAKILRFLICARSFYQKPKAGE